MATALIYAIVAGVIALFIYIDINAVKLGFGPPSQKVVVEQNPQPDQNPFLKNDLLAGIAAKFGVGPGAGPVEGYGPEKAYGLGFSTPVNSGFGVPNTAFSNQEQAAYAPPVNPSCAPVAPGYATKAYAAAPQACAPTTQGYVSVPQSYAPVPQGYASVPQSYASVPQGYASVPQDYASVPQGYAPVPQSYAPLPPNGGQGYTTVSPNYSATTPGYAPATPTYAPPNQGYASATDSSAPAFNPDFGQPSKSTN